MIFPDFLKLITAAFLYVFSISAAAADTTVVQAQSLLNQLGYNAGSVDGIYGRNTKNALERFFKAQNSTYDGSLDEVEISALRDALSDLQEVRKSSYRKPATNPQHARYSRFIKTPLRDFTVPSDFTLVDNWASFMAYHQRVIAGKYQEDDHFYSDQIDFGKCVEDLGTTVTTKSAKSRNESIVSVSAKCHAMLAHKFNNDPKRNVSLYRDVLTYWMDNNILQSANRLQARQSFQPDYSYAINSSTAKMMAHYALYHRLYGFDAATHSRVVDMFESFAANYRYFPAHQDAGSYFTKLCSLKTPKVVGGNDHCGSWNTRIAVGATLFGLEFGSQTLFDKGVQHIEIMLAMFDENHMYTSQIGRGTEGLSYADQVGPAIDQLDYAFQKAFGFDFANMETVHGTTPAKVYQHMWTVANQPWLMLPYYDPDSDPSSRYRGEFRALVRDIQNGEKSPTVVWQAFNERRYIMTVPGLAARYHPELFKKHRPRIGPVDFEFGNRVTGFSVLALREGVPGGY